VSQFRPIVENYRVPPEGETFIFDPPFETVPSISVMGHDLPSRSRIEITNKSRHGVTIKLVGITAMVDIFAKG
jgi:hypothetical protein